MAKTIQIRNVPEDVHAELRRRAAEAGESLSDYVLDELRRTAARSSNAEVLHRAAQRSWGVDRKTIVDTIRDMRGEP